MEVTYTIKVEQDYIQVRGNLVASGDDALDKQMEDEVLARLDRGDVWAWAQVVVVAECDGFKGEDALCGCSYKDEADFKKDGYFEQMKDEALNQLKAVLEAETLRGQRAAALLLQL